MSSLLTSLFSFLTLLPCVLLAPALAQETPTPTPTPGVPVLQDYRYTASVGVGRFSGNSTICPLLFKWSEATLGNVFYWNSSQGWKTTYPVTLPTLPKMNCSAPVQFGIQKGTTNWLMVDPMTADYPNEQLPYNINCTGPIGLRALDFRYSVPFFLANTMGIVNPGTGVRDYVEYGLTNPGPIVPVDCAMVQLTPTPTPIDLTPVQRMVQQPDHSWSRHLDTDEIVIHQDGSLTTGNLLQNIPGPVWFDNIVIPWSVQKVYKVNAATFGQFHTCSGPATDVPTVLALFDQDPTTGQVVQPIATSNGGCPQGSQVNGSLINVPPGYSGLQFLYVLVGGTQESQGSGTFSLVKVTAPTPSPTPTPPIPKLQNYRFTASVGVGRFSGNSTLCPIYFEYSEAQLGTVFYWNSSQGWKITYPVTLPTLPKMNCSAPVQFGIVSGTNNWLMVDPMTADYPNEQLPYNINCTGPIGLRALDFRYGVPFFAASSMGIVNPGTGARDYVEYGLTNPGPIVPVDCAMVQLTPTPTPESLSLIQQERVIDPDLVALDLQDFVLSRQDATADVFTRNLLQNIPGPIYFDNNVIPWSAQKIYRVPYSRYSSVHTCLSNPGNLSTVLALFNADPTTNGSLTFIGQGVQPFLVSNSGCPNGTAGASAFQGAYAEINHNGGEEAEFLYILVGGTLESQYQGEFRLALTVAATPTPSPSPTPGDATPSPTPGDATPSPTPGDATPSPTPGDVTPSPAPTASAPPPVPAGNPCFPADAWVQLESGLTKRMDQIQVGDRVHIGDNKFSDVFFFSHRLSGRFFDFVRLEVKNEQEDTEAELFLTQNHYLPLYNKGNKLVAAGAVTLGDVVILGTGETAVVTKISIVQKEGLYNPHTIEGSLVVNGVKTSCYTTSVVPWVAEMLLKPIYWMYQANLASLFPGRFFDRDQPLLASIMPKGAQVN